MILGSGKYIVEIEVEETYSENSADNVTRYRKVHYSQSESELSTKVGLKVDWHETEIRRQVKRAGGVWNAPKKVWEIEYGQVERLGLADRIVG